VFLKSLEIRGFKSFADKTELKFKKGVTAVVGPNGSGKSNISDSVRWVLGEQSVKTLRGGKMEDVIFAGTQFRKPVGLAQVSLTLDNEDGSLSTDYNEVTVSRRIFRSGETEYLINGTKCRLKDITQLFMDTGIGKEGYSLIGQGKIEAVLSGKPEERRNLLEEAAGIVKYKSRKEEAEKKLDNTDNNLVRIRDIISTYEERIEPLKIEREKALKYKEISEELTSKEVSLAVHFINEIESVLKEFNLDVQIRQESIDEKKLQLVNIKQNFNQIKKQIEEIERTTAENKTQYYNKKDSITKLSSDILLMGERINNIKGIISKNNDEINEQKSKLEILTSERQTQEQELEIKKREQKAKENEILELEKNSVQAQDDISQMEQNIKNLKQNQFELLKGHSDISNSITMITNDIKAREEREEVLATSFKSLEGNIKINKATLEGIKNSLDSFSAEVAILEEGISNKRKTITNLNTKANNLDRNINQINKSISGLEANKTMLSNLEKHYEGYNRSVKSLMEEIEKGKIANAKGTKVLGEIFTVEKEYEVAIEVSLGAAISNVITEDDRIAKELINYLKRNNMGRATFLPLNNIRGNKLTLERSLTAIDGYVGIASELINYPSKYQIAINNVLGRTIICRDMDSALNLSKKGNNNYRIVTLSGELIAPGGALTGGSLQKKFTNILGRKREIEEITTNLSNYNEELLRSQNELEALRIKIKELDEEILNDKDSIHFKSIEKAKKESEISALEIETKRLSNNLEAAKDEIVKNKDKISYLKNSLGLKNNELDNLQGEDYSNKEKIIELENDLEEKKNKVQILRDKLTEQKVNKASLDEVITNMLAEVFRKGNSIDEYQTKLKYLQEENQLSEQSIITLNQTSEEKQELINSEQQKMQALEESFKEEEVRKLKLKEQQNITETQIAEISDIVNNEEAELNKKEIQKAKSEMERENLYTKLNEELELTLAEAAEIAIPVEDVNNCKGDVSRLKSKITALGTVNLAAIEEYQEVKEKYEFMFNQEQDLEKAKKELLEVISDLTDSMKEMFKQNFKILNENFNETFRELFKGGSAELVLGEGDELTANIDIVVEPPGKKLQNINLMSGGEKVLSAIALLFAILKMKPTPFCILDEIEAALDDANVFRYAEFLKEFASGTQFIVITHRKGTMEASDMMYGVTMEEKGVSKVVSVDLSTQI
jgi:chromosome segregation protein